MNTYDHFSRRQLIKAGGVAMSFPYLESVASAKAIESKKRAVFIFAPNGVWDPDWKVQETGADFQLPRSLESLADHKGQLNFFSNLGHEKARANGDGAGDHARSSGTFLTAQQIRKTSGKNIRAGVSFDQVLAAKKRGLCAFDSLEYSMEDGGIAGQCDSGYSCAYVNNISWKNAQLPMSRESRVRDAFERLFGDPEAHLGKKQQAQARMRESSVLDLVRSESNDLMKRLSKSDREKIVEYQDSLRSLEKRVQNLDKIEFDKDFKTPDFTRHQIMDYERKVKLFYDVMTLALQTNKTQVCSLMLGRGGSNLRFGSIGIKEGHHTLSHHKNDENKIEQLKKIDRFHIENFSYFLSRLKEVQEGSSNLLDNSLVLFGSCIRDGNRHDHHDLPVILAGNAGGKVKTGESRVFNEKTPLANLFLGMSSALGTAIQKFGDSDGLIDLN
ncbi:DUF1552 domain-containing protein [Lentisphaera profundi]|uniref:DUF1552 domain-containing protein n=1 Tax=Lentisphaera profundi TaxID=1658616 RepID=A0ABY7VVQ3_9BACT|nr:DUF1552 domain-containing protein [Lentisphaera profundi]WDE97981.1 DUF1552 domain-containing protein [Lentisphaera profundi]